MDVSSVTDSTDWLSTPLSGLAPFESSLRCQVCKEILTTPMITSCSHTFCSLCIRRYLSQEGKCPSCREPDQEMKLRHNYAVEELVGVWREGRERIWQVARDFGRRGMGMGKEEVEVEEPRPKKRRRVGAGGEPPSVVVVQKSGLEERRSTRSQSRRVGSQAHSQSQSQPQSQASQPLRSTQEEIADSDAGSDYQDSPSRANVNQAPTTSAEPHDGLVGCPNCTRRMRETAINTHLDKCLQGMASPTPPPPQVAAQPDKTSAASPRSQIQVGTIAYTQTKPGSTNKRLPTINYSLLTETAMRRKLKELGIPNQGSKELMRKRHGEWVNLWNANCDSLQPVTKGKLLRDLDTWERNLGRDERLRQAAGGGSGGGSGGAVMEKDFDREGYMVREKDNFADLVRKARESRKPATPTTASASENEDSGADAVGDSAQQQPTTDEAAGEGVLEADMQDFGSISNHLAEGASGSGLCQDAAPAAAAVAETLIPSTPPRLQTNGYHVPPVDGQQKQYDQHSETIDLTSATPPSKAVQDYQHQHQHQHQHHYQQQHQSLERSSQISL